MAELSPAAVAALHRQATEAHEKLQAATRLLPPVMQLVAMQQQFDAIVAWAHGGPKPGLTVGAQAVLAQHHKEK